MKYSIDISSDDIQNSLLEEKINFNNFDKTKPSYDFNLDNHIGNVHFKEELLSGLILSDWESRFTTNTKLTSYHLTPIFSMHFMLSGYVNYEISNIKCPIKGGQNNIWSISEDKLGYSQYKKEMSCSSWCVSFEEDFLTKLVNAYPDLLTDPYLRHINGESFCMHKNHMSSNCDMNLIISQIKNAKLMGKTCHLYTQAKVMELLALQLQQLENKRNSLPCLCCLKKNELDKIHEAKNLLLSDINTPPTILDLSRNIGMNEKKLQNGFKEVFNQTVYGCLFDHKMNLARQFLLDTDKTIFEIALECGYEYASHFTTAFKRKYGISPKQFKRLNE
ncbi:helix-turn-helix domain-containing protein [Labilibaculum euxinus]